MNYVPFLLDFSMLLLVPCVEHTFIILGMTPLSFKSKKKTQKSNEGRTENIPLTHFHLLNLKLL